MTSIHLIVSKDEQLAIVNALAFYNDMHATPMDDGAKEQWLMAFKEDNRGCDWQGPIDKIATKNANSN